MRRFFIGVVGGFAVVAIGYFFGGDYLKQTLFGDVSQTPTPTSSPLPLTSELQTDQKGGTPTPGAVSKKSKDYIILAKYLVPERPRAGVSEQWSELFLYSDGIISSITPPDNVDRTIKPVTDGKNMYFLVDDKGVHNQSRSLVAVGIESGKHNLISDSTPLVEPRDVFASNDGKTIAFFLDGTEKRMTELWTYVPEKDRKRVSVERLTQNTVGLFWDVNGGFVVRDGAKFLRGSPNRTGVDILSVKIDSKNILPDQSIILSPGSTQIVYLLKTPTTSTVTGALLHVWDLKENTDREIVAFSSDKIAILGWSNSGSLVVREGDADVKIWNITKDTKENFGLEANAHSIVLAGDGSTLAYVVPTEKGDDMVFRAAKSGKIISQETIPAPQGILSENTTVRTDVLQFLRTTVVSDGYSRAAQFPLAKEALVGYVMGHIREIAASIESDNVVAQRVWFTHVPGAVYVDYLVGKNLWRRLIQVDGADGQDSRFIVIGVYSPAAGEWVLVKGRELADPKTTDLYEFDPESGKWIIRDNSNIQP